MAIGCVQTLGTPIRTQITIPISTGLGATWRSLMIASFVARGLSAGDAATLGARIQAFKIVAPSLGFVVAMRPTFAAPDEASFSTHGQIAQAGVDYYEPSDGDADCYVRSAGAAFTAVAVCYF